MRAIAKAGHEVGCHGDEHERVSDLDPKQEEAILTKSLETLTPLCGRRPVGWRAPAWQLSACSLDLAAKHGFEYSSNMMDRLVPYRHPEAHGRALVEIPVSWVLDDAPDSARETVLKVLPPPARLLYRMRWEPRYRRSLRLV